MLSDAQKNNLKQKQISAGAHGRNIGAQINRQKRLDVISGYQQAGKEKIGKLSNKELLLLGIGLYWEKG